MASDQRQQTLQQAEQYLHEAQQRFKQLCARYNATAATLKAIPLEMLRCPFNADHVLPHQRFVQHCRSCEQKSLERQGNALPLAAHSTEFFYRKAPGVLSILQRDNGILMADGTTNVTSLLDEVSLVETHMPWLKASDDAISDVDSSEITWHDLPPHVLPLALGRRITVVHLAQEFADLVDQHGIRPNLLVDYVKPYLGTISRSLVQAFYQFVQKRLDAAQVVHPDTQQCVDTPSIKNVHVLKHDGENHLCTLDYRQLTQPLLNIHSFDTSSFTPRAAAYEALVELTEQLAQDRRNMEQRLLDQAMALNAPETVQPAPSLRDKSALELLIEQRDYKRRRRSYRAKNVRITKRTQTQIHRDLIAAYMEELFHQANQH